MRGADQLIETVGQIADYIEKEVIDYRRGFHRQGGSAGVVGILRDGNWGHHTAEFDFVERALKAAVKLLSATTLDLMRNSEQE
jgi:hypothetical protein